MARRAWAAPGERARSLIAGLLAATASAVCAAIGVAVLRPALPSPPPQPPAWAATATQPPLTSTSRSAVVGLPRSRPTLLSIPRIGVRTPMLELGLRADGSPELPPLTRRSPAGWLRTLASPGELGPAVILGHVDSAADGPAVFYRLGELRPGDLMTVSRADGRVVTFAVTSVLVVTKARFPAALVYGQVDRPALRLITCGGSFDAHRGHYRDNVIVFATTIGSPRDMSAASSSDPSTG